MYDKRCTLGYCKKNNPDAQYAQAVYGILKSGAKTYKPDALFFSADAKCKIPIGEPGFPLAVVARGKRVIVDRNEVFKVVDHDYIIANF